MSRGPRSKIVTETPRFSNVSLEHPRVRTDRKLIVGMGKSVFGGAFGSHRVETRGKGKSEENIARVMNGKWLWRFM